MKHFAITLAIAALLGAVPPAQAGPGPAPLCCACVVGAPGNGTAVDAIFCAAAPSGNSTALAERCSAASGNLVCLADGVSGISCRAELDVAGYVCPAAGVPAAAPLDLAALTIVLGAAGAALLRRRR